MGTADDKYQLLNKDLQELLQLENRLSNESYEFSEKNASSTLKTYLILSAMAIVLSLAISFFCGAIHCLSVGEGDQGPE